MYYRISAYDKNRSPISRFKEFIAVQVLENVSTTAVI